MPTDIEFAIRAIRAEARREAVWKLSAEIQAALIFDEPETYLSEVGTCRERVKRVLAEWKAR